VFYNAEMQRPFETEIYLNTGENMKERSDRVSPKPYMNPYLGGLVLGLVITFTYVVMGRGLGASGAYGSIASFIARLFAPESAGQNLLFQKYLDPSRAPHPLMDWLVFEVIGVLIGAFISGWLGRRLAFTVEKGPRISNTGRLLLAFCGGVVLAIGAQLARGCMSGQIISGGPLLNLGSWIVMMAMFGAGYITAFFVRKEWR
jgi:uncharacterized protein